MHPCPAAPFNALRDDGVDAGLKKAKGDAQSRDQCDVRLWMKVWRTYWNTCLCLSTRF
jgi:hypothetical protein